MPRSEPWRTCGGYTLWRSYGLGSKSNLHSHSACKTNWMALEVDGDGDGDADWNWHWQDLQDLQDLHISHVSQAAINNDKHSSVCPGRSNAYAWANKEINKGHQATGSREQGAGKRKQKLDTAGHTRNEEAAKRLSSLSTIRILLSTHLLELSVSSLLHFYTFT